MKYEMKNIAGERYGKLVAINPIKNKKTKKGSYYWLCKCDCGNYKEIAQNNLHSGHTRSCGCLLGDKHNNVRNKNKRIYNIYLNMIARCYNKNNISYKNYGAKGITICDEWKENCEAFYIWSIENGYQDNLTIDRINVNGNYEPSNCRWATRLQQANNTTQNRFITYKGETHTLAEWSRILGIYQQKLRYRIDNWGLEKAFNK